MARIMSPARPRRGDQVQRRANVAVICPKGGGQDGL